MRFSVILIMILILGCSSTTIPTSPDSPSSSLSPRAGLNFGMPHENNEFQISDNPSNLEWDLNSSANRQIFGMYKVRFSTDGFFEVIPERTLMAHFNVTQPVLNCSDCFKLALGPQPGPNMFDFLVTLKNPTVLTGYDVTGIIRWSGDIKFLNPSSYTFLFSFPGDTTPNPYKSWDTGVGNREFPPSQSFTETLRFEVGGLTKLYEMNYLINASWPGNQEEPYGIWGLSSLNDLQSNGSNSTNLRCRVGDWQSNIDSVEIDLTPLGGASSVPMTNTETNLFELTNVKYNPTGQGAGTHNLKITATSAGVKTYNYLPVKVVESGPITDGSFLVKYQNRPLELPDGPTDGKDIAVMGASDGTSVAMVFGQDDTYHFWNNDYTDGTFGLYHKDSGLPITPLSMPNWRFDFAKKNLTDTSNSSIFSLSWGEANSSTGVLDENTIPPIMENYRATLWNLNGGSLKIYSNVLVLGANPGPPKTFEVIVRPVDFASGFNVDGMIFVAMVFAAGDDSKFPIVDIMGWNPPLDFNSGMISGGVEAALAEGSGPGVVNRNAIVGFDVDDSGILKITGGYAGHLTIAVAEAGSENALEIIDADVDSGNNVFTTVALPSPPVDVEIIPLTKSGFPANWIAVLCADGKIRLYNYFGTLVQTIGGSPYMIGTPLRLDVDDTNLAIHVLHQGASNTLVTVYKWNS